MFFYNWIESISGGKYRIENFQKGIKKLKVNRNSKKFLSIFLIIVMLLSY